MNSILKKIRQSDAFNEENRIPYTKAIVLMSLFTFVFLGAEFLFVNMISRTVSGNQSGKCPKLCAWYQRHRFRSVSCFLSIL